MGERYGTSTSGDSSVQLTTTTGRGRQFDDAISFEVISASAASILNFYKVCENSHSWLRRRG